MESRGAYFVVSVCISLYRYRYINLANFFGLSFGNFHHQDLFSLNLDLVYGGIKEPVRVFAFNSIFSRCFTFSFRPVQATTFHALIFWVP